MKFPALRRYIKSKKLQEPYSLKNRDLVIDASSFFKNSYKDSGSQFVLGPECDRYAEYLTSKLSCFLDCNINCHVIFKGTTKDNAETIQEKHQKIIDDRKNINVDKPRYFDPLFVTDVQKQVLSEMGIKFFCCEYDSMDAIVGVARVLKCPVLTDNIEYCLFKVSCILPNSIEYKAGDEQVKCTVYEHHKHQALLGVFIKTPILLTLCQNKACLNQIPELSYSADNDDVLALIRWVRRLPKDFDISKKFKDNDTMTDVIEMYERFKKLFLFPSNNLAVNYFRRKKRYGLFKDDKKWFSKGVSDGKIVLPCINIKKSGLIIGSTIINDVKRTDAMLAASKIFAYTHLILTNSQVSTLKFIGRKNSDSSTWDLNTKWSKDISNSDLFDKPKLSSVGNKKAYLQFFKGICPGHDFINIFKSDKIRVPQSCWILIITLVYYIDNVNADFIDGAYFIILSYLLLGPASLIISGFKEKDSNVEEGIYEDAQKIYDVFKFLFRKVDLENEFNISIVHNLAEFQHCLEHMNYLNNLCGQANRGLVIPSTVYHDTFNATFIYNAFIFMRNKDNLMTYMKEHFKESNFFVKLYKDIICGLEMCRHPEPEMTIDYDLELFPMFTSRVLNKLNAGANETSKE